MIYLAYRSGYFPNCRYIKEFEEESILEWFQRYWEKFTTENPDEDDDYVKVLGTHIYGFPIWQIDDEPIPSAPSTFKELISTVDKYIYNNEIIGDENCLKVLTDDDEIELAWFLFTEKYKQENFDNLSIWFTEKLPTNFGEKGLKLNIEKEILPKGNGEGCTYFISCPIYDSANLEDLEGAYKLENVRLPDLLVHLNSNELDDENEEEYSFGLSEINFIKQIAQKSGSNDLKKVLSIFSQLPITELYDVEYEDLSFEELISLEFRNEVEKSKLNCSDHFYEICINSMGEFYNYCILFDDLWVEKNQKLANSLLRFGKNWEI